MPHKIRYNDSSITLHRVSSDHELSIHTQLDPRVTPKRFLRSQYMVYRFISFIGFDLYHAMGSEQEAKSAVNRPVPVPAGSVRSFVCGGFGLVDS